VVHGGGRVTGKAALALDVAEVLPTERRGPYWQSLCAERWPGGTNYPPECNYESNARDYHKRLYLTYRTIGTGSL
jgi:hypothetical protein